MERVPRTVYESPSRMYELLSPYCQREIARELTQKARGYENKESQRVLASVLENFGTIVPPDAIYKDVWGSEVEYDKTLDRNMLTQQCDAVKHLLAGIDVSLYNAHDEGYCLYWHLSAGTSFRLLNSECANKPEEEILNWAISKQAPTPRLITLTPKQKCLYKCFLEDMDKIFSKDELIYKLWKLEDEDLALNLRTLVYQTNIFIKHFGYMITGVDKHKHLGGYALNEI